MKILLAGTFGGLGGIQSHFHWLSRALLESGFEVTLISLGQPLSGSDFDRAVSLRTFGAFELVDMGSQNSGALARLRECAWAIRRFRPDLYIACGTGWNLFLPPVLAQSGAIRIFHEVMSGHSSGVSDSRWAVRLFFHEVIAQASPVARQFGTSFRWHSPIQTLPAFPEPLELSATLPDAAPVTRRLGVRAAFFSRLVPHKRGLWLAQQWPRLRQVLSELHLFGSGPEEEPIRQWIRSRGWEGQIFCHGRYPDAQAYVDLIRSFDMTLLPTIGSEGAPLVLLESMACGVPFVSTDAGGIPDYANPDCLITPVDSDEAFLQAVEEMSARIQRGGIEPTRLQRHYLDNFSYAALSEKWRRFIYTHCSPLKPDESSATVETTECRKPM